MSDIDLNALAAALETDAINLAQTPVEVNGTLTTEEKFQVDGGDWQTLDDLTDAQRTAYDSEVAALASAAYITAVKAEAHRRILDLCPEWKQDNLQAQAIVLTDKGRDNWTEDELADWNAGKALWDQITAIRTRSDEIEAMDPIPTDITDDSLWA